MQIETDEEIQSIAYQILREMKSGDEWALIESSDMFQTEHYCGGYDADEKAFCFSYYDTNGDEYWFQITLEDIEKVVGEEISSIEVTLAQ